MICLGAEAQEPEILAKSGKHRAAKGCLYVKKLQDIDLKVLKNMLKKSIAHTKKAFPRS